MLNDGRIMGYLTGDPIQKYGTVDGKPYAQFTLACERDFRPHGKSTYDFPSFVAYGRMSEVVTQYLKKGQTVIVEYQLKSVSYNFDGRKVTQTRPTVTRVRFDRLRDPLVKVPKKGKAGSEEFYYEGFDEEGLIEHGELENADG